MSSPVPAAPPRPSSSGPPPLVTGVVSAALFAVLLVLVAAGWGPLLTLDGDIASGLHRWAVDDPGFTRVNRILSDWVWDPWTLRALTAVVFLWLLLRGDKVFAVWVAATSAVGSLVQQVLKAAVGRERPQWPDPVDSAQYAAFPSGHAMTATVTFGLLCWLLRRYGAPLAALAVLLAVGVVSVLGVGFTRLYLGVHWFSDVLAGWLLGVALVLLSAALHAYWTARRE